MAEQANAGNAGNDVARELEAVREELDKAKAALELESYADTPDAKLVAALARAQGEYPRIEKTKTGTVSGTSKSGAAYSYDYSYADLGDVLSAVRPVLSRHGLALVQRTTTNEAGKITLVTELRHVGGGVIDSIVELGQTSANPQQFGGALTYLRRYEAGTLLGVAPEEDTDARGVQPSDAGGGRQAAVELPPWATDLSRDRLTGELGPRLKVLLGDEGATAAARTIKTNLGGIPALVSMTAGLIVDTMLAGNPDELLERLGNEQLRRREAAAHAEAAAADAAARAEAEAAQAQAEAPDPAPSSDAGPTDADEGTAAPPTDVVTDDTPAAGTIPPPDLSGLSADEGTAAMRAAGCTCPDPLAAMANEAARVDACPIIGHGIPF